MLPPQIIAFLPTLIYGWSFVEVEPDIAVAKVELNKCPQLIIHLTAGGKISHNGKNITEEELTKLSKQHAAKNPEGILQIRSGKPPLFKHIRSVIGAASDGGLDRIVFSSPKNTKKQQEVTPRLEVLRNAAEKTIHRREHDLKKTLPPEAAKAALPAVPPVLIRINQEGSVFIKTGPAWEKLDADPKQRKLPRLCERLKNHCAAVRAANETPVVKIHINPSAKQQRVIDVLNTLASIKISKVTFADPLNE